jgi:hypothetical protein
MLLAMSLSVALIGAGTPVSDLFPRPEEIRQQHIRKVEGETDWPFVRDGGTLICMKSMHQRSAAFIPDPANGEYFSPVALETSITGVMLARFSGGLALRAGDGFEQIMRRLLPYVTMGQRLCDQPPGSVLPESSL